MMFSIQFYLRFQQHYSQNKTEVKPNHNKVSIQQKERSKSRTKDVIRSGPLLLISYAPHASSQLVPPRSPEIGEGGEVRKQQRSSSGYHKSIRVSVLTGNQKYNYER